MNDSHASMRKLPSLTPSYWKPRILPEIVDFCNYVFGFVNIFYNSLEMLLDFYLTYFLHNILFSINN